MLNHQTIAMHERCQKCPFYSSLANRCNVATAPQEQVLSRVDNPTQPNCEPYSTKLHAVILNSTGVNVGSTVEPNDNFLNNPRGKYLM